MSMRLYAAPRHVHVPERALVNHPKLLPTFGRNINVSFARERRRADLHGFVSELLFIFFLSYDLAAGSRGEMYPEHVLLEDPWHEAVGYGFVVNAHYSWSLFLSLSLPLLLFLFLLFLLVVAVVVVVVVLVVFRSPGREARRGRKKMKKKTRNSNPPSKPSLSSSPSSSSFFFSP